MRVTFLDSPDQEWGGLLAQEGFPFDSFDVADAAAATRRAGEQHGHASQEQIWLHRGTPAAESAVLREEDEHSHLEDEVRLVTEGTGTYDLRTKDERWIRVTVGPGDRVVIPAGRYHRFLLGETGSIRFVQTFDHRSGMQLLYRGSDDETSA